VIRMIIGICVAQFYNGFVCQHNDGNVIVAENNNVITTKTYSDVLAVWQVLDESLCRGAHQEIDGGENYYNITSWSRPGRRQRSSHYSQVLRWEGGKETLGETKLRPGFRGRIMRYNMFSGNITNRHDDDVGILGIGTSISVVSIFFLPHLPYKSTNGNVSFIMVLF